MSSPETPRDPPTQEQLVILKQLHIDPDLAISRSNAQYLIDIFAATQKQRECLARNGIAGDGALSRSEAASRIEAYICERRQLPPTPKQEWLLRQHNCWHEGMTRGQASDLIGGIKAREIYFGRQHR
jgi:hypothetical protein